MFKVIVAGGRDFNDYQMMKDYLDYVLSKKKSDEILVISGGARGADLLGERYALERGYSIQEFPAEWDVYGRGAGYIRNTQMAREADALVAFWDGKSRGTENMIETAYKYGLQVRVKKY